MRSGWNLAAPRGGKNIGLERASCHYWDARFLMSPIQLPAPGRGAYDRSLSRAQRHAEHRERLLLAASEVLRDGPATVARIVERAGVGRSTFYEFFDSPEHVLEQLEQRLLRGLESALESAVGEARTPLERVRALTRSWTQALEQHPSEARVALGRRANSALLSPAGELLQRALQHCVQAGRNEAGWFKAADDVGVLAAAAALEAISRRHLMVGRVDELSRLLADAVVRLLR